MPGATEAEASLGEGWSGVLRKRNSAKARPVISTPSESEEEKVKQLGSEGGNMARLLHGAERCG